MLARNTAILFVAQVLVSLLTSVTVLLMPIYLGDEGLGRLAFAQSTTLVLQTLAALGTSYYIVKTIAADRSVLPVLVSSNVLLRLPLWALGTVLMVLILSAKGVGSAEMLVVLAMAGVTLIRLLGSVLSSALQGLEEMAWQSAGAVTGSAVTLVVGLPLLIFTRSPLLFCVALLSGAIATLAANLAFFRGRGPLLVLPSAASFRVLAAGAVPFIAWALSQGIYGQVNVVVIGFVGSEAAVGWFAAASRFGSLVLFVPVVINVALLPAMSRMYAGRGDAGDATLRKAIEVTLALTLPLAAGAAVLAPRLLQFLHYPSAFRHSVPILVILACAWILTSLVMVVGTGLLSAGRERQWAAGGIFLLAVFLLLNVALVPLAQARLANAGLGAATADVIGEAVALAIALWLLPRGILGGATLWYSARALLATAIMAVVVWRATTLAVPVAVLVGGCAYTAASLVLRTLTLGDTLMLWSAVRNSQSDEPAAGRTPSEVEASPAPSEGQLVSGGTESVVL